MISSHIKPARWRRTRWGATRKRLLAVFSYRYDAQLVPDLLANIDPVVDGWIAFDDRAASGVFSSEPARRRALLGAACDAGANWILAIDPDERLERGVADAVGRLMATSRRRKAWGFHCREMYTPDAYRVDGVWGDKVQHRLFSAYDAAEYQSADLHGQWFPPSGGFALRHCGLNLYHLKMIGPRRRAGRRDIYNHLDPRRDFQPIGYDYLTDEAGVRLETIARGREYHPPHVDDGGMWMADLAGEGSACFSPDRS
ncbi:MAG: hypothetical protein J0J15_18365 [Mesorhizobium sp.]|nr:hypothetical protein [Mesorhizobium sp.]